MKSFDLIVVGSGPAGQRAAVQAAKIAKRVAVIERQSLGGHCLHLGTIPSKTLREAALNPAWSASLAKVFKRKNQVIDDQEEIIAQQLKRNHIEVIQGDAHFSSPYELCVTQAVSAKNKTKEFCVRGEKIILATGSRPRRPQNIPFDGKRVCDSDEVLKLKKLPASMAVMGGGVIGCEYASIFAAMGCQVTLYDQRDSLLRHLDADLVQGLLEHFKKVGIRLVLGGKLEDVRLEKEGVSFVFAPLQKNSKSRVQRKKHAMMLFCMGRLSNVESLALDKAQLSLTECGSLNVNEFYQTNQPHIYAVGDMIGFPALATTSAEQGRVACLHAFQHQSFALPGLMPYGIYTIPEISTVGELEKSLVDQKIPYVVGRARYCELARGQIMGEHLGFLKLLIHAQTRKILGVHVLGSGATELVHIGQVAMQLNADVDFLAKTVFNYPTLAEAYKVAALNALNQL